MAAHGRPLRVRGWTVVLVMVVALAVYGVLGSWSASIGLGGEDGDGNWIDLQGTVVDRAPLTVDVVGHPAPAVTMLLVLMGVAGVVVPPTLARYGHARAGLLVRRWALVAMPVLVVAGFLVFSVWQSHVVGAALPTAGTHPPVFPFGGASVQIGRMHH
ncbi:hypothetical protein ASF23_15915 [Curtobacterium sp. Leaf261]|nr:hypothetical protein ASF23_15915 [Curtobacterium sp. Leaf261]